MAPPGANLRSEVLDRLFQQHAYRLLKENNIVGAAAVVVKSCPRNANKNPMVYMKGFGYEIVDAGQVVDVNSTLFDCGSCAKSLTAMSVMQLWQEKQIDLHQDVNKYLPQELKIRNPHGHRAVTLHNLLTHTSGLQQAAPAPEEQDLDKQSEKNQDRGTYVFRTAQKLSRVVTCPPGNQHFYCAVNDVLAGAVVESVSGMEYGRYIHRRIFSPMGMAIGGIRSASTYQVDVYGYPTAEKRFPEPMSPCGGLVATPAEMAKMLLWLVQPQGTGNSAGLLSETSIFAMQTIHFPIGKSGQGAAYGFTNVKVGLTGCSVLLAANGGESGNACQLLGHSDFWGEGLFRFRRLLAQSLIAVFSDLECAIWLGCNTTAPDPGFCLPMLELLIEEIRPVDMSPETAAAWVLSATPRAPDAVLDLFCFPSAGMSAKLQYRTWQETLPDFIQVKMVQLPGRGSRQAEPCMKSIHEMADRAAEAVRMKLADGIPYVCVGHGMGGILAYEVACRLKCKYNRSPMHIFVSGCAAPGSWQVPILREGKGSNYTPWRQFLKSVPSPADTTLSSGHRGEEAQPTPDNPRLQDHQQASMLHQLDGCERLPKALRHPDKVPSAAAEMLLADIIAEESYRPRRSSFTYPRFNPLREHKKESSEQLSRAANRQSTMLACPIMAILPSGDTSLTRELVEPWTEVTEGAVVTLDVLGPHNYFEDRDALEMVINAVAEASAKQLSRYAHMYLVASDK